MKVVFVAALLFAVVYSAIAVCPSNVPCVRSLSSVCGRLVPEGTFVWYDNQCCLNAAIDAGAAIAAEASDCAHLPPPGHHIPLF